MDESLRKINIISAIKEIFHILQKPDIHYSVKKIPLLVCARSTHYAHTHTHTHTRTHARMHAHAHTHTHILCNTYFSIISSRKPRSSKWFVLQHSSLIC